MPNWCYNSLTIEGNAEDISAVKSQLNTPFQREHDQWNMETKQMEKRTVLYPNPVFSFWNIIKPTNLEAYNGPQPQVDLSKAITFESDHWYDWNVRNWGTKWDVAIHHEEQYPETELIEDWSDRLIYSFNTAWSPPVSAIEELSKQYPNLTFTLSYEEETGWGGEVELTNGEGKVIEEYENKCRDCDSLNTMEYCENDCGEICSECNYLGEADMECVAECEVHSGLANAN